ncbi:MAG: hypothetical protein JWM81_361 [Candidatus Saccharibacteria bacterium]|nr:hypothetical protein [Candidatus Saccharibacteria bacterium]
MSYNFSIYCPVEEYTSGEAERVRESELSVGGLYMVMFALHQPRLPVAVRYPAVITDLAVGCSNDVGFITLDNADLRPHSHTLYADINDGQLHFKGTGIVVQSDMVVAGYFKGYAEPDATDRELRALLDLEAATLSMS